MLRFPERLHFQIRHSLAGQVGEVTLLVKAETSPAPLWAGEGFGSGSFLGFGTRSKFSLSFDPQTALARAWTVERDTGSAVIRDDAAQSAPGVVSTHRLHSKKPESWATLNAGAATYDPFGYLLALRTRGPQREPWTAPVLDGRALWSVTAAPPRAETIKLATGPRTALRYELAAAPIDWQGRPSTLRKPRTITLWLSDNAEHTPLALVTNAPLGELRVELAADGPAVALH